jgi:UDP:flavonoid glycosyltransferase YjiC (YdhE family)
MRVLFSTTGGDGHVLPLLPLARAFASRRHDVSWATARDQRSRIEEAGLTFEPAGPNTEEIRGRWAALQEELAKLPIPERRAKAFSGRFADLEAPLKLEPLRGVVERCRPDLLVYEPSDVAAPIAAAAAGVPSVNHSFGLPIPEAALRAAAPLVAALWEEAGVEPDPLAGAFRGAYVDICPPSLAVGLAGEPSILQMLRPVDAGARAPEPRDRPLVYVTLGTVFNRVETFRTLLDAFAPLDVDVVMTIGSNLDVAELDPIPANARVERYIPQAEILPRADAVVAHGGSGSFLAALAHGLPLALVPHGADQFENAAACAAIGVAEVVLPADLTVERARSALDRVLAEPTFASIAQRLGEEIAAMPSAAEAAVRLEAWARTSAG